MLDRLFYGLQVTVVGMLVVFAGLVILIGCVAVLKLIFARNSGKKRKDDGRETAAPETAPAGGQVVPSETVPVQDARLMAVITAAVMAMLEKSGAKVEGFFVRKVRRVNNTSAWNNAGREEQIYSRF